MMIGGRDNLIVGGGVIGLSFARELHLRGAGKITVIDAGNCGGESSWAAAGMLCPQVEADESGAFFEFCLESRDLYPALAAELLDETGIDIELDRAGTLYLAFSDEDVRLTQERFHWQTAAGLAVEHLPADEVRRAEPFVSPDVLEALYFPGDWQVENRKLCSALRRYCEINGVEIIENTTVTGLSIDENGISGVKCGNETLRAGKVVIAAGAWASQILPETLGMPIKVEPVRGQMISMHTAKRLFERVIYGSSGYIVPRVDGRVLAGSTTEKVGFDREINDTVAASLFSMACGIAPSLANLRIEEHWSGFRPRAVDGLPVIGRIEGINGLYFATAHYRNGILLAPATAALAADMIIDDEPSRYQNVFGPDRFRSLANRVGN